MHLEVLVNINTPQLFLNLQINKHQIPRRKKCQGENFCCQKRGTINFFTKLFFADEEFPFLQVFCSRSFCIKCNCGVPALLEKLSMSMYVF